MLKRTLGVVVLAMLLVVPVGAPIAEASFPGENGLIAFSRYDSVTELSHIFVVAPDGTGETAITDGSRYTADPTWSPDGKRILYEQEGKARRDYKIFVMNADGKDARVVADGSGWDFYPAWSPDGKAFAFVSDRRGRWGVYVKRFGTRKAHRITSMNLDAWEPDWSPDGRWILFYSDSKGGDYEMYKIRTDGTRLTALTDNEVDDYDGSWAPDGKSITFTSNRNSPGAGQCAHVTPYAVPYYTTDCMTDIFVMKADGSDQLSLTPGPEEEYWPVWSPDGTQIAYTKDTPDGGADIWVMNVDGSNQRNVTPLPGAYDYIPDWQASPR